MTTTTTTAAATAVKTTNQLYYKGEFLCEIDSAEAEKLKVALFARRPPKHAEIRGNILLTKHIEIRSFQRENRADRYSDWSRVITPQEMQKRIDTLAKIRGDLEHSGTIRQKTKHE